jgi:hypothetical protein
MIELICTVCVFILVSFTSATILICLDKWKFFDFWNMYGYKLRLSKDPCVFCIGFWIAKIQIFVVYFFVQKQELYFIVPLAAASLIGVIYENFKVKRR